MWRRWEWRYVGVGMAITPFLWRLSRWRDGPIRHLQVGPLTVSANPGQAAPVVLEQTADGLGAYLDRYDVATVACSCGWHGPPKHLVPLDGGKACPECAAPFRPWEPSGWRDGKRVGVGDGG